MLFHSAAPPSSSLIARNMLCIIRLRWLWLWRPQRSEEWKITSQFPQTPLSPTFVDSAEKDEEISSIKFSFRFNYFFPRLLQLFWWVVRARFAKILGAFLRRKMLNLVLCGRHSFRPAEWSSLMHFSLLSPSSRRPHIKSPNSLWSLDPRHIPRASSRASSFFRTKFPRISLSCGRCSFNNSRTAGTAA